MIFNDFEKEIIHFINSKTVFNVKTFIEKFITTEDFHANVKYTGPGYNQFNFTIDLNQGIKIINDSKRIEKMKSFISILEILNKNDLIFTYEIGPDDIKSNMYSLFIKDNTSYLHDTNLFHLTGTYLNKEFKPNSTLNDFIQNNYLTEHETTLSFERNARKTSELWTRIIAVVSILVNVLLVLFQHYSSTQQRDVKITNFTEITEHIIKELPKYNKSQGSIKTKDSK